MLISGVNLGVGKDGDQWVRLVSDSLFALLCGGRGNGKGLM